MKYYLLFTLLLSTAGEAFSQANTDYIITWNNDTINCRLPGNPRKEGLKPAWKYKNGHVRMVAYFDNDSVATIKAGDIKAYVRQDHGKGLLCDGEFESIQVHSWNGSSFVGADEYVENNWFFLNRLVKGKYASLYVKYLEIRSGIAAYYYLVKHDEGQAGQLQPLWGWKKVQDLLADKDIEKELRSFRFARAKTKFTELVREYNRLKEAAAVSKP